VRSTTPTKSSFFEGIDDVMFGHALCIAVLCFRFPPMISFGKLRFSSECKKRWNMSQDEIDEFWSECIADSTVPKGAFLARNHLLFCS